MRIPSGLRPPRRLALAVAFAGLVSVAGGAAADQTAPPLPDSRWRAFQTGTVRADRLQHASLALTVGMAAGLASRESGVAFVSATALGLGKECVDAGTGRFDWGDLFADLVGAGAAGIVTHSLFR